MPDRHLPGLRRTEPVMGTVFSFDVRGAVTPAVEEALDEAVALLHRVDALFSTYRPDSAVNRLERGEVSPDLLAEPVAEVLTLCAEAERRTEGCFSLRAAGRLDPSGLVKGWAVEAAATLLADAGADGCCVNGAGDVQARGEAAPGVPWRIGIADPRRPGRLLTAVTGWHTAVATSGVAERGQHITDPRTGSRPGTLLSATVTGPSLTWADAYATAAVVMGEDAHRWIERFEGYELLTVPGSGEPARSPGFPVVSQPLQSPSPSPSPW